MQRTPNFNTGTDQSPETLTIPSISFPKGGGAIQGMGEKFSANPVTGTASFTVPIAATPGRNGFGPNLILTYNSGAGNGPFGLGWSLSLPAITRKTEKGLPQYNDENESDTFLLSDVEDLVPVLIKQEERDDGTEEPGAGWVAEEIAARTVGVGTYRIKRYRPRIEGLFSRIERWTSSETGESYWKTISRDNIVNIFGRSSNSRIEDPWAPPEASRVFKWLLCESYDDSGNCIYYSYKSEDASGIDLAEVYKYHRRDSTRFANRYLKQVSYGNRVVVPQDSELPREYRTDLPGRNDWLFELLFDYGEGHYVDAGQDSDGFAQVNLVRHADVPWPKREDSFSNYRAGFEVRTDRLCRRVLMLHHMGEQLGEEDYLVKSTDFTYDHNPYATTLTTVVHSGYRLSESAAYRKKSLPPLEFEYSKAEIRDEVNSIEESSLDNLPQGIDDAVYRWIDLDGEGTSGILTGDRHAWYYKRNISPLREEDGGASPPAKVRFAGIEQVPSIPAGADLTRPGVRLMDLDGTGLLDVVDFTPPVSGYFERSDQFDWKRFRRFKQLPVIDWQNPDIRFIDLTGDGLADILLTEDDVFLWHQSMGEEGYSKGKMLSRLTGDHREPMLLLADRSQSVYLADFSGDGLTDIVRIRNGEVCYWPNLGYGRFGMKVTMGNTPIFDRPDQFDQRRIRLADIDGSGTVDILYLRSDRVCIYRNQSGNSLSDGEFITSLPPIDDLSSVSVKDLLGNGTSCLVWSTLHTGAAGTALKYIDLMGGKKPHLLLSVKNNLGAETRISYTPSTTFYLWDKRNGNPWVTRLPFPVHCVEKVTLTDTWRQTEFTTKYSYHHGYYDPHEREFRGFGRVEKVDVEDFGRFQQANSVSPYVTDDETLYQPPIKTITWFHTGASQYKDRQFSRFSREFFPHWLPECEMRLAEDSGFAEKVVCGGNPLTSDLPEQEWRDAFRACKGRVLREEVYELDVAELAQGNHERTKLFSASSNSFSIRPLQPQNGRSPAVFQPIDEESLTYHYELELQREQPLRPDPRISHSLVLETDDYGQPLQKAVIGYPRWSDLDNAVAGLTEEALALVRRVQGELHIGLTEVQYTDDVMDDDNYRLRLVCEISSYEITGAESADFYFTMAGLRSLRLAKAECIDYHHIAERSVLQKRRVEQVQHLFFDSDLLTSLPFGELNHLALPYESYRLALTDDLIDTILEEQIRRVAQPGESYPATRERLMLEGGYCNRLGSWWIRSGTAGFSEDAAEHFYLPERYVDQFGQVTEVNFDPFDLYVQTVADPLDNVTEIVDFDYRVMAPVSIRDVNGNISATAYDLFGLPVGSAMMGKEGNSPGDNLTGFAADISSRELSTFWESETVEEAQAADWLAGATSRFVYSFGERLLPDSTVEYGYRPPCACSIVRERHLNQLNGTPVPLQISFGYSDGLGQVLVTKGQAEPENEGGEMRWLATGKSIFNNKGKVVKRYEPYFSATCGFEEPVEAGVTTLLYYDSPGRLIRTEMADGSYSRVEISPWSMRTYDANDTLLEDGNPWYETNSGDGAPQARQRAARLSAVHADTPAETYFDSLGREVVQVAHNRWRDYTDTVREEKYISYTKLDAEGKPLWIRDARNNLVMQYVAPPVETNAAVDPASGYFPCYDIAGNLLFQYSMDSGSRWMLSDSGGSSIYGWDSRGNILHTEYDELRRPKSVRLQNEATQDWIVIGCNRYGDEPGLTPEQQNTMAANNLRGVACRMWDQSGEVTRKRLDWNGNVLWTTRRLAAGYEAERDWSPALVLGVDEELVEGVMEETYHQLSEYDALNRTTRQYLWYSGPGSRVSVSDSTYNKRNLLSQKEVIVNAEKSEEGYTGGERMQVIRNLVYSEKGQRLAIEYGNGTISRYSYDDATFRLIHLQTVRQSDGRNLQDLHYCYDPAGNITEVVNNGQQTVFYNNASVTPHSFYTYDALYRLIEAQGREHAGQAPRGEHDNWYDESFRFMHNHPHDNQAWRNYTERFRYDSTGNILEHRHLVDGDTAHNWSRRYQYSIQNNRLLATGRGSDTTEHYTDEPDLHYRYHYNEHGSITSMPHLGQMDWNSSEMIGHIARIPGSVGGANEYPDASLEAWYCYDRAKNRTRKRVRKQDGTIEERFYFGSVELFRKYDNRGVLLLERETIRLRDDSGPVVQLDTKTVDEGTSIESLSSLARYQLTNHLGSVSTELDQEGQIISYEEYHPFGTTSYQAQNSRLAVNAKRYRYTGLERDEETGLSCHTARYYVNWLARWASSDPTYLENGTNSYRYVSNNPVRFFDSNGKEQQEPSGNPDPPPEQEPPPAPPPSPAPEPPSAPGPPPSSGSPSSPQPSSAPGSSPQPASGSPQGRLAFYTTGDTRAFDSEHGVEASASTVFQAAAESLAGAERAHGLQNQQELLARLSQLQSGSLSQLDFVGHASSAGFFLSGTGPEDEPDNFTSQHEQHISYEDSQVIAEINRVLAPGGVVNFRACYMGDSQLAEQITNARGTTGSHEIRVDTDDGGNIVNVEFPTELQTYEELTTIDPDEPIN